MPLPHQLELLSPARDADIGIAPGDEHVLALIHVSERTGAVYTSYDAFFSITHSDD